MLSTLNMRVTPTIELSLMCHPHIRRETRPSFVGVASSIPFCSSIPATSRGHGAGSVGVFHRYATATEFATCVRPTRTLPLTALATRWLANGSGSMGSLRARAWPCRSQSGGCAEDSVGFGFGFGFGFCSELRRSLRSWSAIFKTDALTAPCARCGYRAGADIRRRPRCLPNADSFHPPSPGNPEPPGDLGP